MKGGSILKWVFFVLMIAAVYFVLTAEIVQAQNGPPDNRPPGNHNDDGGASTNTFSGGDVSVPVNVSGGDLAVSHSSKAFALSNNLGDVDIAGCLGSTQWGTPIFSKQDLKLNWPCMAEFYLKNEKYDLAAMAICNTEVIKEFADEAECEAAHNFNPVVNQPDAALAYSAEHTEDYEQVLITQNQLEEQIQRLEQRPAQTRVVERVVEQAEPEPLLSEQEKLEILGLLMGGYDEDE